jgi:DMSO/TMAO reductase YedYZ molybdopterin-dependent catalytic subunit
VSEADGRGSPVGRRVVLGMLGLGALGVVAGRRASDGIDAVLGPLEHDDPTGLTSLIPGGDEWRFYTVTSGFPSESDAAYRLTVDGLVDRPVTYDLPSLKALPATSLVRDFQCVTGWRVPTVHWTGVLLSDLLDRAGVRSEAKALRFESFDGVYTESLTLDQARRPDVIVAWSMLGAPVTRDHGGPVRLYVAPMYGYKSCKWLSRIQVVDRVEPGYWEVEGNYSVNAWIGASNGE